MQNLLQPQAVASYALRQLLTILYTDGHSGAPIGVAHEFHRARKKLTRIDLVVAQYDPPVLEFREIEQVVHDAEQ